ncbi:hypothetical protein E2562_030800 [Oryza meyeriana var. granulata]|uniref:DUF740 family protein n=1 Tax=Oryza meyeriana var. granulata TaxID=110450 RepID=A0A6G1CAX4_9ORYZ|nr:hypothetical protein E2562_030800 [Oryza meyeriana var. granulata]
MEYESSSVSVCGLHPGVAVTGFCPACLRDRLAGLHPPSADLRRCKSFSYYARSSASSSYLDQPHRRSCDARQHDPLPEEITGRPMKDHISQESSSSSTRAFGALGKRWQEWRRKTKLKKHQESLAATTTRPLPPELSVDALGRRSCDAFSSRSMLLGVDEPRASCDGRLTPMLFVPRSDDQIPVEEEEAYEPEAVPGGSVQTRDYYLDSSSSSRRRRSVDRKSFSSDAGELPTRMAAANARVSPAVVGAELYQQQQSSHYQYQYQCHQPSLVEPPFLGREEATKSKPKSKGIKGMTTQYQFHKEKHNSNNYGDGGGRPPRSSATSSLSRSSLGLYYY